MGMGGGMGMGNMAMGGQGMGGGMGMMQGGGGMCMGQMGGGPMMGNQLGMQMNGFGGGAGQMSISRSSSVATPGSIGSSSGSGQTRLKGEQLRRSVLAEFDSDSNGKLEGSELKAMRLATAQRRQQSTRR